MARLAGKNMNFAYNSVQIEDELNSASLSVDNNLAEVTAFADDGSEFVEGLPNSTIDVAGSFDGAASQGDATIFSQIGSGEAAYVMQPTGTAAGANDPNYTGNAVVSSYSITADVGGAVSYTATFQTNGKPTRAVS